MVKWKKFHLHSWLQVQRIFQFCKKIYSKMMSITWVYWLFIYFFIIWMKNLTSEKKQMFMIWNNLLNLKDKSKLCLNFCLLLVMIRFNNKILENFHYLVRGLLYILIIFILSRFLEEWFWKCLILILRKDQLWERYFMELIMSFKMCGLLKKILND